MSPDPPAFDPFEALLDQLVPGAGRQAAASVDAPDFPAGLGLEPLELLARGGTGWIFRARDPRLGREVAVKIARPDQGRGARQALLGEARRTAALAHPSVLPVHRVVVIGELVCVEYQLAPRTTLEALLADPRALARREVPARLGLLRGPAGALQRAHELGHIHGDLHPGNLVIDVDDQVYLLDWAGPGPGSAPDSFSGSPSHAAPEVLAGAPGGPAADVFALGVVAWELCAGLPMRPRQRGEDLGAYITRWQGRAAPALPGRVSQPAGLSALLQAALAPSPDDRATAAELARLLEEVLSGEAERGGRRVRGEALLAQARETLARYRELGQRLEDERQVVAIQQARVPGHAPNSAKRGLWEAEDRLESLQHRRDLLWLDAVQQSVLAGAMGGDDAQARDMVAELWWVRMEDMAARGLDREQALASHQVGLYDPERRGAVLQAPCRLSLQLEPRPGQALPAVTAALSRFVQQDRRLLPAGAEALALPLDQRELAAGSWLVTVTGEGLAPTRYPVRLDRAEHHDGRLRLYADNDVGEGWVYIPAGPFLLGGDLLARRPMPRCRPTLGDRFMRRTCVTVAEWLDFLHDLPLDEARRRVPGARGPTGTTTAWWPEQAGRFILPADWEADWPIVGIDAHDAAAFADWTTQRTGRPQRLPTEEEWEKAARGVDGRSWPWGEHFDPSFAHMRSSRVGEPGLGPVGAFPADCSPYGCLDMAGSVREWTGSWMDHGQVVVRGGSWKDEADDLRCAARSGRPPHVRSASLGFRLVSEAPVAGRA